MQVERSILEEDLVSLARDWIQARGELYVVIRFSHSGGAKDYYLFNDCEAYEAVIRKLPPQADVILFNQWQLPYRGVADEELKGIVRPLWRKGEEWMLTKLLYNAPLETGGWWDDASDIDRMFDRFRDEYVGVGPTPAWWESDHADMRSGLVPLEDGTLKRGVY